MRGRLAELTDLITTRTGAGNDYVTMLESQPVQCLRPSRGTFDSEQLGDGDVGYVKVSGHIDLLQNGTKEAPKSNTQLWGGKFNSHDHGLSD